VQKLSTRAKKRAVKGCGKNGFFIHKAFVAFCRMLYKSVENTFMQARYIEKKWQNVDRKGLSTKISILMWITSPRFKIKMG
jgi:hypothetical protein